jgi:hypothetical protein
LWRRRLFPGFLECWRASPTLYSISEGKPNDGGYVYSSAKETTGDLVTPVFVEYNFFSLQANEVAYDPKNSTIKASGDVVAVDESGATKRADSMTFKLENGQAIPLRQGGDRPPIRRFTLQPRGKYFSWWGKSEMGIWTKPLARRTLARVRASIEVLVSLLGSVGGIGENLSQMLVAVQSFASVLLAERAGFTP